MMTKWAVTIRHAPAGYEGPNIKAHVTTRVQRIWFEWWDLKGMLACRNSARTFYGADRVTVERW